jgi:hypothetical protein
MMETLFQLPRLAPESSCTVRAFDNKKYHLQWAEGRLRQLEAKNGASYRKTQRLAVCITGGTRSFTEPAVYTTLRAILDVFNPTYLRIFFVLNLTYEPHQGAYHSADRTAFEDLFLPISALGPENIADLHIQPSEAGHWPGLAHDPLGSDAGYAKCAPSERFCPVQWKQIHICARRIASYEQFYQVKFDWVFRTRADLHYRYPLGNLRIFENDYVHTYGHFWPELKNGPSGDARWALIPRSLFDLYADAFGKEDRYICHSDVEYHNLCGGNDCGCMLFAHLRKNGIATRTVHPEIYSVKRVSEDLD